jgi:hypothetical protein
MPESRIVSRWVAPAAAVVLSASAALAQAPPLGSGANPNELRRLYDDTSRGFDDVRPQTFGPSAPATALPSNVDIDAVRRGLDAAARDANDLYRSLDGQSRYVPAVRQYLGGLVQLQSTAGGLSSRIRTVDDLKRYLPELRALDSDWDTLSYNLKRLRGLDSTATGLIARIDQTGDSLGKLLQMGPGVDYREIVLKANSLVTAMDRLIDDIDYQVGRTSQGRQLIYQGQQVEQQARHLSDSAFQQTTYDGLVQDFKLFQQLWSPFAGQLRQLNDKYLDRDAQQVAQAVRDVSTLLRMEQTLDRQQLLYMADQLTRDVDDFFSRAPLKILIKLPQADRALSTADEFYGNFENFVDCVNRGENQSDLQDTFGYIDGAWRNFAAVYRPLNSSDAQQVLNAIEKDVNVLRDALLIQGGFDRAKAADLAALVENLSGYLERDTRSWLRKAQPPYAAEAQRDVTSFRQHAQELHEALVANANLREVQQMSDDLFDNWRRVYGHIIKCQTSERSSLAATSSQTTPALVELRTLLAR